MQPPIDDDCPIPPTSTLQSLPTSCANRSMNLCRNHGSWRQREWAAVKKLEWGKLAKTGKPARHDKNYTDLVGKPARHDPTDTRPDEYSAPSNIAQNPAYFSETLFRINYFGEL